AIGAGAFWRHGVDAGDGLGEDAVQTTLMIGPLLPGCLVADLRRAEQARAVTSVAVLGDHVFRGLCSAATASGSSHFHTLAFLPLNTHLADGLEAFGDVVICRSLSADSPEGQYGC